MSDYAVTVGATPDVVVTTFGMGTHPGPLVGIRTSDLELNEPQLASIYLTLDQARDLVTALQAALDGFDAKELSDLERIEAELERTS